MGMKVRNRGCTGNPVTPGGNISNIVFGKRKRSSNKETRHSHDTTKRKSIKQPGPHVKRLKFDDEVFMVDSVKVIAKSEPHAETLQEARERLKDSAELAKAKAQLAEIYGPTPSQRALADITQVDKFRGIIVLGKIQLAIAAVLSVAAAPALLAGGSKVVTTVAAGGSKLAAVYATTGVFLGATFPRLTALVTHVAAGSAGLNLPTAPQDHKG